MSTVNTLLTIWLTAAWVMAGGWAWQRRRRNAGIVDALWAAGLAVAAVFAALVGQGATSSRLWVALLGGAWGARLALHLWRRVRSEPEDGRYRQLRAHWHGHQGKFFGFFQFQAFLVGVCAVPFIAVAANGGGPGLWIVPAVITWIVSVAGESLADRQLARFRADPANHGRTCRDGLWRYSRHPNYFFEWLHWFTYVFLAMGSPLGRLAWIGPVLMFVFVRYVSGVPLTEAQAVRTRGDDYRRYQRDTPVLIPWFPMHTHEDV
ncbi:steroid 5-alpha reductase family enzyme [Luteibacter sp. 621]